MSQKYFEGCFSFDALALADLERLTAALAVLEALAKTGTISFELRKAHAAKSIRSDRKAAMDRKLQPQQLKIINFLRNHPDVTAAGVRDGLGIPDGSANAAMNKLMHLGIATHDAGWPRRWRVADA